jgi:hypothetical protein
MKKSVVSLVLAAVAVPVLPAEPPVDRLVGCADIRDSRDRLACFDREIAPLASARARPAPAAPVTPATTAAPAAPPAAPLPSTAVAVTPAPAAPASTARTFGDEQLQRKDRIADPGDPQSLNAKIERIRTVSASDFIVYLDNGQAWRHQDAVLGGYLREGEAITISKGALGSYRLTRDAGNSKNWIRVTRIR